MQTYIRAIKLLQNVLVGASVLYLMAMPAVVALIPEVLPEGVPSTLFSISLAAVTFVMAIRPLADLVPSARWLRSLVILRKGFGVLSASIIVSFILAKCIAHGPVGYLTSWFTVRYYALDGYALFAHLGDMTAIVLLVTSNNFSKRILGPSWKRVQKLAYVYFYAGAFYHALAFQDTFAYGSIVSVTLLVCAAFVRNRIAQVSEKNSAVSEQVAQRITAQSNALYQVRVSK